MWLFYRTKNNSKRARDGRLSKRVSKKTEMVPTLMKNSLVKVMPQKKVKSDKKHQLSHSADDSYNTTQCCKFSHGTLK